jgi:hypothetical protein
MSTETLEAWAAREAPTMDNDEWRATEWLVEHDGSHSARALLAYRDKVAAGLTADERYGLYDALESEGATATGLSELISVGLVGQELDGLVFARNFGREIARVLLDTEGGK